MRENTTGFAIGFVALAMGLSACTEQVQPNNSSIEHVAPAALKDGALVVVGPAVGTDKPGTISTTLGYYPALASNGDGFLAVETIGGNIRGTRIDANGSVLDQDWLDFSVANYGQYYADVAFGDGRYLVAWWQSKQGGTESSIQGRLVKPDGSLEGNANFQLSSGDGLYPSLAWDGTQFVAAWLAFDNDASAIHYARFSSDGSKIAGSEQAVPVNQGVTNPQVAAGTNYTLISWQEYEPNSTSGTYNIRAVRIDKSGSIVDNPALFIGPSNYTSSGAAVASSGSRFLVAWSTASSFYTVHGSILDDQGRITQSDFTISHSTADAASPTIDFDGTNFVVAWADARGENASVYGVSVSPDGIVGDLADKQLSSGGPNWVGANSLDRVNIAYNGSRHLLNYFGQGIEGTLIDKSLNIVKDEFNFTSLPSPQSYPHAVYDGTNFVLVWTDESDPDRSRLTIRSVRIDANATVLDPDGILVTPQDTYAYTVAAASAGKGNSLFAYATSGEIPHLRLMLANGTLSNPTPLCETTDCAPPRLASNGRSYFATYSLDESGGSATYGRIIGLNGSVGAAVRVSSDYPISAAIPTKDGYLVACVGTDRQLISVSDTGAIGNSSALPDGFSSIAGAFSGEESLIVWDSGSDYKVRGRFFKEQAWSGEEFVLSEGTKSDSYPAVVWDGTGYYVAWEIRDGDWGSPHKILGRSVSRAGTLGAIQTLVSEDSTGAVLNSNAQGRMLLSYLKWIGYSNSRRVYSRLLLPEGVGGSGGAAGTGSGGQGNGPASTDPNATPGGASAVGGTSNTSPSSAGAASGQSTASAVGGATSSSTLTGGVVPLVSCSTDSHSGQSASWVLFIAGTLGAFSMRRRVRRTQ